MGKCINHLDYVEEICPDCGCEVDEHGNTCDRVEFCPFPDCGCDGARLCMAENGPSERSATGNVEGMWAVNGSTPEERKRQIAAGLKLVGEVAKEKKK